MKKKTLFPYILMSSLVFTVTGCDKNEPATAVSTTQTTTVSTTDAANDESLPTETVPTQTGAAQTDSTKSTAAELVSTQVSAETTLPVEITPTETTPAETTPVETTPAQTTVDETIPVVTTPVETVPQELPSTTPEPQETSAVPSEPGSSASHEKRLIVIDAGHQRHGNYDKEPIGPGSSELKAKVSSGTEGCVTGLAEYELNLTLALKLEQELRQRGYEVQMVRTSHDVDLSNSQRAAVANEAHADAFIRIHANSDDNSSVNGAMTLCQTPNNPYNGHLYSASQALSANVLDELVNATGCRKRSIWETDTMSGINWCQVPVTIVEVGFMSNPEEDRLLATDDYQNKLAIGIANGIDKSFR